MRAQSVKETTTPSTSVRSAGRWGWKCPNILYQLMQKMKILWHSHSLVHVGYTFWMKRIQWSSERWVSPTNTYLSLDYYMHKVTVAPITKRAPVRKVLGPFTIWNLKKKKRAPVDFFFRPVDTGGKKAWPGHSDATSPPYMVCHFWLLTTNLPAVWPTKTNNEQTRKERKTNKHKNKNKNEQARKKRRRRRRKKPHMVQLTLPNRLYGQSISIWSILTGHLQLLCTKSDKKYTSNIYVCSHSHVQVAKRGSVIQVKVLGTVALIDEGWSHLLFYFCL